MKTIIILFALILTSFGSFHAQHIFPLHVGDKWDYWTYPNIHLESSVVNDTTMSNGKHYYDMKNIFNNHEFYRQQGDSVFIYYPPLPPKEYLIFDFSARVGDIITSIPYGQYDTLKIILSLKGKQEFFNAKRESYGFTFMHTGLSDGDYSVNIKDSLGVTTWYLWGDFIDLSSAKINNIQFGNPVDVKILTDLPSKFHLSQNYPNPFNPTTTIKYSIPRSSLVSLKVYDLLGREIASLVNEQKAPGVYTVNFNGGNYSSGIYFYRLRAGDFINTKKLMLIR